MSDVSNTHHKQSGDNPIQLDRLLNRVLNCTDEAWRAAEVGRAVDYSRVESAFNGCISGIADQTISIANHQLTVGELAKIMNALVHAERLAKKEEDIKAYMGVVKAVEPITDRAKLLDTQKRPS